MEKSGVISVIIAVIGSILLACGMSMCILLERPSIHPGAVMAAFGSCILLVAVLVGTTSGPEPEEDLIEIEDTGLSADDMLIEGEAEPWIEGIESAAEDEPDAI
ncbi:MAG: hypothetical protein FWG32_03225 [Oscillospiraceae bacterium]|nr:hypothetical protein [Oscillospiraceae bacterium]